MQILQSGHEDIIFEEAFPEFWELCAHFFQCLLIHLKQIARLHRLNREFASNLLIDDSEVFLITGTRGRAEVFL